MPPHPRLPHRLRKLQHRHPQQLRRPRPLRLLHRPTRPGLLSLVKRGDDPNPAVTALSELAATVFADLESELRRAFPDLP